MSKRHNKAIGLPQGEMLSADLPERKPRVLLALNDPDERVQARALALIEQDWVRAQTEEK